MSKKSEEIFINKIVTAEKRVAVGGRYKHAKASSEYIVTDLAIIEATEEVGVVYQAEYGNRLKWARSIDNFLEEVELNGKNSPRFVQISEQTNREVIIDKIAWVEIKDGKILSTLSKGKDKFYFPGGKRESGENDAETLIREVKEELSVDIKPDTIKYIGVWKAQAHGKPAGTVVKMSCYTADYDGDLAPSSEIDHFEWLTYADRDRVSLVDQVMMDDMVKTGIIKRR